MKSIFHSRMESKQIQEEYLIDEKTSQCGLNSVCPFYSFSNSAPQSPLKHIYHCNLLDFSLSK